MTLQTLTLAHQKLTSLAGRWLSGPSICRIVSRVELNQFFLTQYVVQESNDEIIYEGRGILGFDTTANSYTLYWIDSTGNHPESIAKTQWDQNKLVFIVRRQEDSLRYSMEVLDRSLCRLTLENSIDQNSWSTLLTGVFEKLEEPLQDDQLSTSAAIV